MKQKIYTLILLLTLTMISCSSDDDSNTDYSSMILGKWTLSELEEDDDYWGNCAIGNDTREFLDNNSLVFTWYSGNNCQNSGNRNLSYEFEGNNKIVIIEPNGGYNSGNDYIEKYEIKSITDSKLILELYFVDEGVNGEEGFTIPSNERYKETWIK